MFSYSCPACAQKLLAPFERAGQRTICPKCLKPLTIPSPSMAEEGDPHDGLLHAGPLVDDDAPTHPTGPPQAPTIPPPRPAAASEPTPVLTVEMEPPPARKVAPAPAPPRPEPDTPPPSRPQARPPARVAVAVPTASRMASDPQAGRVQFTPTGMAGVDLAADLAADLTMRMKPPPEPTGDLYLAALAWVALTALAGVLWVAGVLYEPGTLPFVALIGVLLVAVGYLWSANTARTPFGLVITLIGAVAVGCGLVWVIQRQINVAWSDLPSNLIPALILPAVSLVCALPLGVLRLRPLRYIITGELLVVLFVVSPAAQTAVQKLIDQLQPTPAVTTPPPLTLGEKVRRLAEQKAPDAALTTLAELADPESAKGASPVARAELGAELSKLAGPDERRDDVRAAALAALAVWQPEATRSPVLVALRSADPSDRRLGLSLAGRWADPEVAAAVAARLPDRLETAAAQKALRQMGGPAVEGALLPLLKTEERGANLLVVMELLELVGGPKSVAAIREVEKANPISSIRDEAKLRADNLAAKLKP